MKRSLFIPLAVLALLFAGAGAALAQSYIGPVSGPPNNSSALFFSSSTRALGIGTSTLYTTQGSLILKTLGGAAQHILLFPNGKVGIGTSTPTSTLTVQGDIFVTGNIYGISFVGGISGSMAAANITSDVFGRLQGNGNFAFPASLGIATTTQNGLPQALSVYGGGYFTGSVGIGALPGAYRLNVNGTLNVSNQFTLTAGGINLTGAAGNDITLNGNDILSAGKISVATIDPLYDIGGVKYSTYAPSIAGGVYEEYVGNAKLGINEKLHDVHKYTYTIDFDAVPEGSDLWVWRHAVDFSKENVSVFVTPYGGPVSVYYAIGKNSVTVTGDAPAEFSLRLAGKRFDWRQWPTKAADQSEPATLRVK